MTADPTSVLMKERLRALVLGLWWLGMTGLGGALETIEVPVVDDPNLEVVLFAREPLIQHPVAAVFDSRGRLLVVENQTHFRPEDWQGPETDQVVILSDEDGDGLADKRQVFFDGSRNAMGMVLGLDGWVFLSCRDEILRVRDRDGDGVAEEVERHWVRLTTETTYPHNGLSGMALDADGGLYFGLGENFGAMAELKAGGFGTEIEAGEGGSVWWVDAAGQRLKRVAGGFWNPFGLAMNRQGVLFATDNDPGSRPPSRLIHVTKEGDYGFQFRYGRGGRHPFVSWMGERLGTLPPLAATGEAPCGLLYYLPQAHEHYRGLPAGWLDRWLVASWADHRVDGFVTRPREGSSTFDAEFATLCQGGAEFRPVALATAPDGSLFVTDWVKRSYELHGCGRVWQIRLRQAVPVDGVNLKDRPADPGISIVEEILTGPAPSGDEILDWLKADEPRLFHAAVERLSREGRLAKDLAMERFNLDRRVRGGLLLASRRGTEREGLDMERLPDEVNHLLQGSLADSDAGVQLLGLHWVSDHRIGRYRFMVEAVLADETADPEIYRAALTALRRIDGDSIEDREMTKALTERLGSAGTSPKLAQVILKAFPGGASEVKAAQVAPLIEATAGEVAQEWFIHYLGLLKDPNKQEALVDIFEAEDRPLPRAAVLTHLEPGRLAFEKVEPLVAEESALLRSATLAFVGGQALSGETQRAIGKLAEGRFEAEARRALGQPFAQPNRPAANEVSSWSSYLERLPREGQAALGRQVFMSARRGGCAQCHVMEGLGAAIGPDLSGLAESGATVESLLRSLLQPSAEISPSHEAWRIVTRDGEEHLVSLVDERGGKHRYIDGGAKVHEWEIDHLVVRQRMPLSIMPSGILDRLTDAEIRDLLAYLMEPTG